MSASAPSAPPRLHDARAVPVPRRTGPAGGWLLLALGGVLGFVVRILMVTRGVGLLGLADYDDGVYYTAASALVHGRLPYRDFLFLQPPGITVGLAPFAGLGALAGDRVGFAAARIAFAAVGGVNAALVGMLLRRYGRSAVLLGAGGYAVFLPAVYAERSALLEPLGTLCVLVGLVLVERARGRGAGWAMAAGAVLGLAPTVKIWFVVTVLVVAVVAPYRRWYLAGAAAALGVVYLPFLAAAPVAAVREIVLDQLGRPRAPTTIPARVATIFGAPRLHHHFVWATPNKIGVGLLLVTVVLAVAAWRMRAARVFVVLLATDFAVLLLSPSWFPHYAALTAPAVALTAGVGIGVLTGRLPSPARLAVAAVALLGVAVLSFPGDTRTSSRPAPPAAVVAAAQRVRGCVTSDDPTALVLLDVLRHDIARGCTVWPDVTGWTYDADSLRRRGHHVGRAKNARWQAHVLAYLTRSGAFVHIRHDTGLSKHSRGVVARHRVLARGGSWVLRAGHGGAV